MKKNTVLLAIQLLIIIIGVLPIYFESQVFSLRCFPHCRNIDMEHDVIRYFQTKLKETDIFNIYYSITSIKHGAISYYETAGGDISPDSTDITLGISTVLSLVEIENLLQEFIADINYSGVYVVESIYRGNTIRCYSPFKKSNISYEIQEINQNTIFSTSVLADISLPTHLTNDNLSFYKIIIRYGESIRGKYFFSQQSKTGIFWIKPCWELVP